jgi:hypothetical protein
MPSEPGDGPVDEEPIEIHAVLDASALLSYARGHVHVGELLIDIQARARLGVPATLPGVAILELSVEQSAEVARHVPWQRVTWCGTTRSTSSRPATLERVSRARSSGYLAAVVLSSTCHSSPVPTSPRCQNTGPTGLMIGRCGQPGSNRGPGQDGCFVAGCGRGGNL